MGCQPGHPCDCPECSGHVAHDEPAALALDWGERVATGQPQLPDFWAAAVVRGVYDDAIERGASDTQVLSDWVHSLSATAASESLLGTRFTEWNRRNATGSTATIGGSASWALPPGGNAYAVLPEGNLYGLVQRGSAEEWAEAPPGRDYPMTEEEHYAWAVYFDNQKDWWLDFCLLHPCHPWCCFFNAFSGYHVDACCISDRPKDRWARRGRFGVDLWGPMYGLWGVFTAPISSLTGAILGFGAPGSPGAFGAGAFAPAPPVLPAPPPPPEDKYCCVKYIQVVGRPTTEDDMFKPPKYDRKELERDGRLWWRLQTLFEARDGDHSHGECSCRCCFYRQLVTGEMSITRAGEEAQRFNIDDLREYPGYRQVDLTEEKDYLWKICETLEDAWSPVLFKVKSQDGVGSEYWAEDVLLDFGPTFGKTSPAHLVGIKKTTGKAVPERSFEELQRMSATNYGRRYDGNAPPLPFFGTRLTRCTATFSDAPGIDKRGTIKQGDVVVIDLKFMLLACTAKRCAEAQEWHMEPRAIAVRCRLRAHIDWRGGMPLVAAGPTRCYLYYTFKSGNSGRQRVIDAKRIPRIERD